MTSINRAVLALFLLGLTPADVLGQEPSAGSAPPQAAPATPAPRPTGLPGEIDWTFNFDAGWGTFGFANSLFLNPKDPDTGEDLSDQWFEGYVKPALTGTYSTSRGSQFYGKVSVVGERTYGSVPELYGSDVSSFGPEDAHLGWRSGTQLAGGDNVVDVTIGRAQYRLGHGFLLYDGASEGGSRGGYWTNARKAFAFAAIGRVTPGPHRIETFYLDKDELEESNSDSRLWGANYEISIQETTTVGVTYMRGFADQEVKPGRDGLNVFNIRAFGSPIAAAPDASVEFEYASERNGDARESNAWTLQGGYELSTVTWKPKLSYRYAFFQGDEVDTVADESFDPLFLGFYDWGSWWQGEIAGEYFLSNSNLTSHLVRTHVTPLDSLGAGLMFFWFGLDEPASAGEGVTSSDVGFEVDLYADWKVNTNFTVSLVGAYADPATAVQQMTGRTKNFSYGMAYVGYSF